MGKKKKRTSFLAFERNLERSRAFLRAFDKGADQQAVKYYNG